MCRLKQSSFKGKENFMNNIPFWVKLGGCFLSAVFVLSIAGVIFNVIRLYIQKVPCPHCGKILRRSQAEPTYTEEGVYPSNCLNCGKRLEIGIFS